MTEKVTISDIAQQSGVSNSTVSLVLNYRDGISRETRERVLATAKALGYPLKPAQPASKPLRLGTVGLVVKSDPDTPPHANPFYSNVLVGIEDVCRSSGVNVLFTRLPVDLDNHPTTVPTLLHSGDADGILMVGTFIDRTIESVSGERTPPIVLVDGYSDSESYDAVVSDNFQGAYDAVQRLIELGHRHIGMAGSEPEAYPSLNQRRNGYRRALKDNDIDPVYFADFNINQKLGKDVVTRLLQENPQVSAMFGVNDEAAVLAMRVAQELGRRVPEDFSVIGYDDTYLAANAHPPLTTMRVDTVSMGRAAMHLLQLRIENPDCARMTLTIHPTLVERNSVSSLP